MPIKVDLVARIIGKHVIIEDNLGGGMQAGDFAGILTNLEPLEGATSEAEWLLEITIGEGADARSLDLNLPPFIKNDDFEKSFHTPIQLFHKNGRSFWYFKEKIYKTSRSKFLPHEIEEIELRIKLHDFEESQEVSKLRRKVSNLISAIENSSKSNSRRRIPDDVQVAVFSRDGGQCVKCDSNEELHFDHVIPFSKGGSDTVENIQILCRTCNLKKSASIGG